jgi:hypothetical protein
MFRFNGGVGGVVCDKCGALIDEGLSLGEYEETWGKHGDDGDFCMRCKLGYEYDWSEKVGQAVFEEVDG